MKTRHFLTLAMIASLGFFAAITSARQADDKLSSDDKDLVKRTRRELETLAQDGRLARTNSNSQGVQHFAELAVRETGRMIMELHELGKKYDFTYDADPTTPDVKDKKQLENLKGQEFDEKLMSTMAEGYQQVRELFKKGEKADNKELRGWYKKNMDEIELRGKNAQDLYKKVKNKEDRDEKRDKKK